MNFIKHFFVLAIALTLSSFVTNPASNSEVKEETTTISRGGVNPEEAVLGYWMSENKQQKIEVYRYNGKYYGKVVWMQQDDATRGTQMLDTHNADPNLRSRHITGVNLLHDFYYDNGIFYGYVYDPISGSEYKCRITLSGDGRTAYVRGYVFMPMFGRTEVCTKE